MSSVNGFVQLGILAGVQALDVAVHFAADQLEPLRVLSNGLLVAGAVLGRAGNRRLPGLAGLLYLVLNLLFLWENGLINPATQSLRIPLFAFVGVSLSLTAWMGRSKKPGS